MSKENPLFLLKVKNVMNMLDVRWNQAHELLDRILLPSTYTKKASHTQNSHKVARVWVGIDPRWWRLQH